MSAMPGAGGAAGRSTQHGGCGGPANVASRQGRASTTEDRPPWRETRCAPYDGSRPMDDPEQCIARLMPVNVDESPACVEVETSRDRQLQIGPRGPFRLDLTAWALRRRSHNAVDRWDTGAYERVVSLDGAPVALSVRQVAGPDAPRLSIVLAGGRIDQPAEALARSALDRLLGLSVDLSPFAAMAAPDPLLGPLAGRLRGLKPPRFPTVFEALVNGVACQQLSLAVGIHLLNRLAADRGRATSASPEGPRAFPDPEDLASLEPDDLKRHGFSSAKARTIIESARAVVAGDLDLEALQGLEDGLAIERLTSLRGVGRWTAEYVLLRGLGRLHVFPGDDIGAHNKLRQLFRIDMPLDHEAVGRLVERWHPYAGVVYFHLLLDSLSRAGLVAHA
jgi:DNA-3-methyladenine glycosylase II